MEIPLEILNLHEDGFHLLVEVVVFGQPFKAVIDRGASKTVFDKTLITDLVLEGALLSTDRLSTGLGTISMESFLIRVTDLKIGGLLIREFESAVMDLSNINHAYKTMELQPIIGVIGGDILMDYKAIIDYGTSALNLFEY